MNAVPFEWRDAATIPLRTDAERARYEDAPALDGDVPPLPPSTAWRFTFRHEGERHEWEFSATDADDARAVAASEFGAFAGERCESWRDVLARCSVASVQRTGRMTRHTDYGADAPAAPWQLPIIDATRWIGREPPARQWIVEGWLARSSGALLVGEDGIGKSLLAQMLCTCVVAGLPFLGLPVVQSPALYLTCEDDEDELWRRQRAINAVLGLNRDAFPVMLSSLKGHTATTLTQVGEHGDIEPSPLFNAVLTANVGGVTPGLIVLDNLAHLFEGNENARRDVAAFCSLLDRLAMQTNSAAMVLGHPNKAGAEYSGSTGWSAHVRQRWFMERPEDGDRDARVIRKSKANYSSSGDEVAFRWHEWAFICDADLGEDRRAALASIMAANGDNGLFLACLDARARDGMVVSPNVSPNYAPSQFEAMPEAKGIGRDRLRRAMERLRVAGEIEVYDHENRDKGRSVKALRRTSPDSPGRSPGRFPHGFPDAPRTAPHQTPDAPAHTPLYYVEGRRGLGGPPTSPGDEA